MITRIAPSPTGPMHIGTARTALLNWLMAKQANGKFVLRIEDTDKERSNKIFEQYIYEGLEWLGLDFDGDVIYQSDNDDIYEKYITQLLEEGKAYYAWETAQEIEAMREEAKQAKKPFVYREIKYTDEQINSFKQEGRKPVVRFRVEPRNVTYTDLIKWDVTIDMGLVADFVIQKSDGSPIFYIANVIDDYNMKITDVIRGEDHISNTPKQILLYEAFGWDVPRFGHMPLLLNKDGKKMSKRDTSGGLVTVLQFKEAGFLPEAVINFVILLGWHTADDREFFTIDELVEEFSIDRVTPSNPRYDFDRALWFNAEYMRKLSTEEFIDRLVSYLKQYGDNEWQKLIGEWVFENKEYNKRWVPEVVVRLQTFGQFAEYNKYLFRTQMPDDEIIFNPKMKVTQELVDGFLPSLVELLEWLDAWNVDVLKEKLIEFIKSKELKNGQVLWPIRAILTGVQASPGAFEMMYILGKQETIKRLEMFMGK